MFEKALKGNRSYWIWITLLLALAATGFSTWLEQQSAGFVLTGMDNGVVWGLYRSQLFFFLALSAAVPALLIAALGGSGPLARLAAPAAFLGVSGAFAALAFILADTGMPGRLLTYLLHFSPSSPASWIVPLLGLYLLALLGAAWGSLGDRRRGLAPRESRRTLYYSALPLGIALPVVAAFSMAVMPSRELWNSALLAPRLMVSGLAAAMALLLGVALVVRNATGLDYGRDAIGKLAGLAGLAGGASLLLFAIEAASAFLAGAEARTAGFGWLLATGRLAPLFWFSAAASAVSAYVLLTPGFRSSSLALGSASLGIILFSWLDCGLALLLAGQVVPGSAFAYLPTLSELMVTAGIWASGALLFTMLLKVAVAIDRQEEAL